MADAISHVELDAHQKQIAVALSRAGSRPPEERFGWGETLAACAS